MQETTSPAGLALTAFRIPGRAAYPRIVRASADRHWMDTTTRGWANRCLPLRIANQTGWFILNDASFEVTWNGSAKLDALKFKFDGDESYFAQSMFGFGIVTWTIPYLFRTEAGFNLIARGPANLPKDGATALDGIIETDWLPYPFTMNWQLTRPGKKVRFEKDEPICMILPVRRADVEAFEPSISNLESKPELHRSYQAWHEARLGKVQNDSRTHKAQEPMPKVQGNYIRGEGVLQEKAPQHQNKINVRDFVEQEPAVLAAVAPPSQPPNVSVWKRLFGR